MTNEELIQKVNRFIVNNQQLERLQSKIGEFNPFKILKVDHYEIRHSNILGWLLDPRGNHALGDTFLKKIISGILCGDIPVKNHKLQISDVLLGSYHDAEILREWGNIDLLLLSKKNNFILLVENKVHAGLASHQLQKYLKHVKSSYPGIKHIIPVYLTLNGDESPNPEYYSLSHVEILNILKSILEFNKENMNSKIYDFIAYYVRTLEVLTMQDDHLINLCREIYRHHKEAIDTIVKYGATSTSTLNQAVELLKHELNSIGHDEDPDFFLSDAQYWFIPNTLDHLLPRLKNNWRSPRPVTYFFAAEETRLRLILEVGPITDGVKRLEFLNYIVNHDSGNFFSIKANALKKTFFNGLLNNIDSELFWVYVTSNYELNQFSLGQMLLMSQYLVVTGQPIKRLLDANSSISKYFFTKPVFCTYVIRSIHPLATSGNVPYLHLIQPS